MLAALALECPGIELLRLRLTGADQARALGRGVLEGEIGEIDHPDLENGEEHQDQGNGHQGEFERGSARRVAAELAKAAPALALEALSGLGLQRIRTLLHG